jgi:hypothetical protein
MRPSRPGFAEDQRPVATVNFVYPGDEPGDDLRRLREEIALNLLRLLCGRDASPKQIGQRTLLLLYAMGKCDFKNKAELAARLGVSRARVSQLFAHSLTPRKPRKPNARTVFAPFAGFQDLIPPA